MTTSALVEDGEQDGADEPREEARPERARAVHGSIIGPRHAAGDRLYATLRRRPAARSRRSPTPRTVRMRRGSRASSPSLWRKWETWTSSERSTLGIVAVALGQHGARELLARHRLPRAARQDDEHAELERRELDLAPVERRPCAPARRPRDRRPRCGPAGAGGFGSRAPEDGAHPCQELAGIERFGHVVVGADARGPRRGRCPRRAR